MLTTLAASQETRIQGEPISRGIAIGPPFFFQPKRKSCIEYPISEEILDAEINRYKRALDHCKQDILNIQSRLEGEGAKEIASILETHLQFLQDSMLTDNVEQHIRKKQCNAEAAFEQILSELKGQFEALTDPFFRERFKDIEDLARRVHDHLSGEASLPPLASAPAGSIVFAYDLPVSDAAEVEASKVGGFVTAIGSSLSHAAIVAKAKGIPCVSSVDLALLDRHRENNVIVDGRTGEVIVNPTRETLKKYRDLQKRLRGYLKQIVVREKTLYAETFDGHRIRLSANLELLSESLRVHSHGAEGVGLFRSEYILLPKTSVPSEEEQFKIYRKLTERLKGLPTVIRAFDIGGDKLPDIEELAHHQYKGAAACRSLRLLLNDPKLFKTQLKAILRAACYGNISILLPMVSGLSELLAARTIIRETEAELEASGIAYQKGVRIGSMIEVPSAVLMADSLAKHCDFFSIGTNDLVQYSLASDRGENTNALLSYSHPAILRMLKIVTIAAQSQRIPVTVCGEMAADPRFTALLIGIGVNEFSVNYSALPIIKNAIRNTSLVEALQLAQRALSLDKAGEVQNLLRHEYREAVPEDSYYNC